MSIPALLPIHWGGLTRIRIKHLSLNWRPFQRPRGIGLFVCRFDADAGLWMPGLCFFATPASGAFPDNASSIKPERVPCT